MLVTPDSAAIVALVQGRADAVFAYPTETVYGLGARITDAAALERILTIKGRDAAKGMIVLVADMTAALALAEIDAPAEKLLERLWPGPLSAVLKARPGLHPLLGVNGTISLRLSPHPLATALCRALGPITSTSANPTGLPPARTAEEVVKQGLKLDAILDGGQTAGGVPSTVADLTVWPPRIIREGALASQVILGRG